MKILITGGNGFIGRNLNEYLSGKHEIISIDVDDLNLTDSDAVDNYFLDKRFDVLIHTAVIGGNRKIPVSPDMLKNNLRMFFNIIRNKNHFGKMIFIGSGAEYDKSKNIKEVKEEDFGKNIPYDDYGFYKYLCSTYIENLDNAISLRVFGVFGKYEDYETRFISNIICRIIFNLPVELNQNAVFDFVYVDDLCRIIEYFIENKAEHKFYNIGSEKHLELLDILRIIKKVSGKDFEIKIKNPGMNKEYNCDNSRLREELKDFRFSDIETSIKELYNWYLENKDNIKKESLLIY